jgi:acetyl esterase/lipase
MTAGSTIAAATLAMMTTVGATGAAPGEGDAMDVTRIEYGHAPEQFGDLWLPEPAPADALPVVVLVHGGFWRARYALDLMDPLAADLVDRGFAVWNLEYRRVGQDGGGYPGTLADVGRGVDRLTDLTDQPLDLERVAFVGHSAGGHLAFWAAGRDHLRPGEPGAGPALLPGLVIGQGPVGDLVEAARFGAGSGAVLDLMVGTPDERTTQYQVANPAIGPGVAVAVVRGERDDVVLPEYSVPAAASPVTEIDIAGEDHFDLIDPSSESWAAVVELLDAFAN